MGTLGARISTPVTGFAVVSSVAVAASNAMLLNEFLKEHRKNEEQEPTIARLKQDSTEQHKAD
jgi:hypothetical protein